MDNTAIANKSVLILGWVYDIFSWLWCFPLFDAFCRFTSSKFWSVGLGLESANQQLNLGGLTPRFSHAQPTFGDVVQLVNLFEGFERKRFTNFLCLPNVKQFRSLLFGLLDDGDGDFSPKAFQRTWWFKLRTPNLRLDKFNDQWWKTIVLIPWSNLTDWSFWSQHLTQNTMFRLQINVATFIVGPPPWDQSASLQVPMAEWSATLSLRIEKKLHILNSVSILRSSYGKV